MILLFIYWVVTTIVGTAWLSKTYLKDQVYISVGEILSCVVLSMILAWAFVPIWSLFEIKIKIK